MKKYIVYKHISPSKKVYIGITHHTNGNRRWKYGEGYRNNPHFWNAIKKYGWKNFKHEIIYSDLSLEEAKQKEQELIKQYNSTNIKYGYNISPGGDIVSEETIKKIQKTRKEKGTNQKERKRMLSLWKNPIKRQEIIDKMQNKPRTEEQKQKMRASNYMRGKHHTVEARKKMSIKAKQLVGEKSSRGKRVLQISPYTLLIVNEFVTAKEAAIYIGAKPISRIAAICSKRGKEKDYFYKGYYWIWKDESQTIELTILSKSDIKSNGKRVRKSEDNPFFGKHLSKKQKDSISRAHRKPVICLDNNMVFNSCKEAAEWAGIKNPEIISRCIRKKYKSDTAGGFHWQWYIEK